MAKMTNEQTKKIEAAYQQLQHDGKQQLEEHKEHLRVLITEALIHDGVTYHEGHETLIQLRDLIEAVRLVKLVLTTVAEVDSKPVVQVVYEYPDELVTYLRDPSTPQRLRACLDGGVELP